MVFEPHPRAFFKPDEPLFALTTLDEKLRLFRALELDFAAVIAFDAEIAGMPPADFADACWSMGSASRHVVVGYDFYFGKGRAGTPETMRQLGAERGFGVTVIAPLAEAGEVFSSSAVRARLSAGDVRGAAIELGHWWRVTRRRHRRRQARHRHGLSDRQHSAGARHGARPRHLRGARRHATSPTAAAARCRAPPTSASARPSTTARRCSKCSCSISTATSTAARSRSSSSAFVRPDQRFPGMEALIVQMDKDCARARELLAEADRDPLLHGLTLGRR